ncbi:MAG: hypothetical protein ACREU2_09995 [Steroidobacteraceae bacterium]
MADFSIPRDPLLGYTIYPVSALRRLVAEASVLFPGMLITTLRPLTWPQDVSSLLVLRWDREPILRHGILPEAYLPIAPKRQRVCDLPGGSGFCLVKRELGQLLVRYDVFDTLEPEHPLALFRPSAILRPVTAPAKLPEGRPTYLRLVVDNAPREQP